MFLDYTKLVLLDYNKKLQNGQLPLSLKHPTTAKIKEQCSLVCTQRFSRKDGVVLNEFFEEGNDVAVILSNIKECDSDKFKPLVNFLKKKTNSTDPRNIELLAWLIDYHPRPYDYKNPPSLGESEIPREITEVNNDWGVGESKLENSSEDCSITGMEARNPIGEEAGNSNSQGGIEGNNGSDTEVLGEKIENKQASKRIKLKAPGLLLLAALIGGGGIYWFQKEDKTPYGTIVFSNNKECMYWTVDHYEAIPCGKRVDDRMVVALDTVLLRRQKKLDPRNITANDIRKVYYFKSKGKMEFYAAPGNHPIESRMRLKPLTENMYEKYLQPLHHQDTIKEAANSRESLSFNESDLSISY